MRSSDDYSQCPATTSIIIYRPILANQCQLLSAIGVEPASYCSHNFRRGGATFAFCHDAPNAFIKAQGDWKRAACVAGVQIPPSPSPFNACHAGQEE